MVPSYIRQHRRGLWDPARAEQEQEQHNRRFAHGHRHCPLHGAMHVSQYLLLQEVQSRPAVDHGAADEEMLLSSQPEHSIGENHPPEEDGPDYERRDEEEQWVADPSPQARYLTRLRAQYGHSFRVRIVSG